MTHHKLRSFQRQHLHFGILFLVGVFLVGCAVAPQPSVEVHIEPIEGRADTKIHPETGAVTVLQKGVAVTIEPLDEVEIFELTDDPRINPYLIVGNHGNVESIYTVFEMTVHNLDTPRVLVEESAVLLDKNGAQYANLPYDYFEDLYDNVTRSEQNAEPARTYPHYHSPYRSYYPHYRTYVDIAALEEGQAIVAESLFESGKLFKGAKRRGLLIFERLNPDNTEMRIIVPEISVVHSEDKQEKLKFKFDFRQVVAEKSATE
ncbi:hypothetical protein C6501_11400 [Candidatus Poribacteria bacterium]|nr:MAG: hypothetical protein C6501_11400 [Candidatus Poribacteria bacterium]